MYELTKIGEKSYYISCPANIGVYEAHENSVYLIDSGNDKEAGRKVRQILDKNGWKLEGILVTHSNADHIGGCRYLQQQTGCKVFAPGIEQAFTQFPILEPSFLYGGYPPSVLRHKFLLAQECNACSIDNAAFPHDVQVLPLPGHFFDMVGYRLPDGTVFMADCVSSAETLEKYQIGFIYDVQKYLDTLDNISEMKAATFVPSHTSPCNDMHELAAINKNKVIEISETIIQICREPQSFEVILQKLFSAYNLAMDFAQYVLVGSTVKSYLSWLADNDRLTYEFKDSQLLWISK